ncbi:MAG: LPS assembly lipoprotein LptE [Rhizomicrobium sp.]
MKAVRTTAALALAFAASGCGFHPLYGNSADTAATAGELALIYVDPIDEQKLGYELRNTLIDLFDSSGRAYKNAYRLHVTLSEKSEGVAVQNDAAITRYNDTLTVRYTLTDKKGAVLTQGTETGLSAYNVVASPYASLMAQKDSDIRSAEDIAYRIRTDLAVYFAREAKSVQK